MSENNGLIQNENALAQDVNSSEHKPSEQIDADQAVGLLLTENNFANYLKLLKKAAEKYCVIVVSCETPWGFEFNKEKTSVFMDIGFKTDLFLKFRASYAAVIDSGTLVFEKLEENLRKPVEAAVSVGGNTISLYSGGFHTPGPGSSIKINGKEWSPNMAGLTFAVYDKETDTVLDTVSFDLRDGKIYRSMEYQKITDKFLEEHPGVSLLSLKLMRFPHEFMRFNNDGLTYNEQFISKTMPNLLSLIVPLYDDVDFALKKYYNKSEIEKILTPPESYIDRDGVKRFKEQNNGFVNIVDGHRWTAYQPDSDTPCNNNIYIYIYWADVPYMDWVRRMIKRSRRIFKRNLMKKRLNIML